MNVDPIGVFVGSAIYRRIVLDYDREQHFAFGKWLPDERRLSPSICAVARWIHRNVERENIVYPLSFVACASLGQCETLGEVCTAELQL